MTTSREFRRLRKQREADKAEIERLRELLAGTPFYTVPAGYTTKETIAWAERLFTRTSDPEIGNALLVIIQRLKMELAA